MLLYSPVMPWKDLSGNLKKFGYCIFFSFLLQFTIYGQEILVVSLPKLNIAIPSPPSDKIDIDRSIIVGNSTPHLQQVKLYCWVLAGLNKFTVILLEEELCCDKEACDFFMLVKAYLKRMLAQIRPIRVAWVLGLVMSFLPAIKRIDFIFIFSGVVIFASCPPSFGCASCWASTSPKHENHAFQMRWGRMNWYMMCETHTIILSGTCQCGMLLAFAGGCLKPKDCFSLITWV